MCGPTNWPQRQERDWIADFRLPESWMREPGMTRWLPMLMLGVVIGLTSASVAQPNQDAQTGDRTGYAPIVLQVACGGLAKPACVKVVPRIAARTSQAGIVLKSSGSGLALDTAAAVCDGEAAAAVVQRDALALIARQPSCTGRYDVVGKPLYPWYAFLVVKAGAPFRELGDMAQKRLVVTGSPGSSGQIALGFLLRSDPNLQRSVGVSMGDPEIALTQVATGAADGFFMLDTLDSSLIDRIRLTADAHGKPFYAFIDIRPPPDFFRIGDGAGHCLFRLTALDFGGSAPVTTISEDTVMILSRASRDAHAKGGPQVADALASAIDAVEPAILADMKSPGDWRPAGTACQ
jgi:hypothetical protein